MGVGCRGGGGCGWYGSLLFAHADSCEGMQVIWSSASSARTSNLNSGLKRLVNIWDCA